MRIVSLCPSLTELVFDLGCGEDLVGITKFCIHPAQGVAGIEKVGGTKNPAIERIIDLSPDLVLLNNEENRIEDAERLQQAGLNCHTSMPRSVEETAQMVRSIAATLGRDDAGGRIALDIETRSERVRQDALGRPAVRWIYLIWREPWMSVNADTFVEALFAQAGGINVFGQAANRYPEVSLESIAAGEPDAVFLSSEPFPFQSKHIDELVAGTSLPRERFRLVDGEYLSWHGSRTPDGVDYAAGLIETARIEAAND